MNLTSPEDQTRSLRWIVYWLLILSSLGACAGRIMAVNLTGNSKGIDVSQNLLIRYGSMYR